MRKPIPLSEKRIMVSMRYSDVEALHNINEDVSTAVEILLNEIQKKDQEIMERDTTIEKLANGIDVIQQDFKEIEKEENRVSIANQLKDLQVVLQNHLDYLNRNVKK